MEIKIGPYKISQRTEYSKIRLFDVEQNKDISGDISLINKIMKDYNKQLEFKDIFFQINDNCLTHVTDAIESENIKYLFIPEGITSIGPKAIKDQEIEFIKFPDSLQEIREYAFSDCNKLKYIDIPNSVTKICFGAFRNCYKLEKINLPNIEVIEKYLFCYCYSLKEIIIPNSVKCIEDCAFMDCHKLENITLSKNLEQICNSAFRSCYALSKINLPYGLKIIGKDVFSHSGLKEVVIPDSVNMILDFAFFMCEELNCIALPNKIEKMPNKIFGSCSKLKDIIFPDSIKDIGEKIFYFCKNIENINIPKNLSTIDSSTFVGSSLKSLTFNHDLKDFEVLFTNGYLVDLISKTDVNKLIINSSVKTITPDAFQYSGWQITSIDYLGSKEQFEEFKNNNNKLFEKLSNLKKINFLEKSLTTPEINFSH